MSSQCSALPGSRVMEENRNSASENIPSRLDEIKRQILIAQSKCDASLCKQNVTLVAVSKTKPPKMILAAYEHGHRNFGENYVEELLEKASDPELENCNDIKWHFIGHLQSNKVKKLLSMPNLFALETVDSLKLAKAIDSAWMQKRVLDESLEPLRVMIQVNTSDEKSKSGVSPDEVIKLAAFIKESHHLQLFGLMTIGSFDNVVTKKPNPDFLRLIDCRQKVAEEFEIPLTDLQLSMGMSHDFDHAIELGSTNVRVGSSIFGARGMK